MSKLTRFVLPLILLTVAGPAGATCLVSSPKQKIAESDTVFIATILTANVDEPRSLKHGEYYKVTYTYEVRKVIKGDPSKVTFLRRELMYNDPLADTVVSTEEFFTLEPGDSVPVFADGAGGPAWAGSCEVTLKEFADYVRDNKL